MLYRIGADAVMLVHFGFILFVAAGALLTWRWPHLIWAHLPALAWGVGTVVIGFPCPLTSVEKALRIRGGAEGYDGGFVDHYIEDVVYPDEYAFFLRLLALTLIVMGYAGRRRRIAIAKGPSRPSRKPMLNELSHVGGEPNGVLPSPPSSRRDPVGDVTSEKAGQSIEGICLFTRNPGVRER